MTIASLDFTLQIATTPADLRDACAVRAAAYDHHLPGMGERLGAPDALDLAEATAIVLARCKRSGRGIGTARIQSGAFDTLLIERSVTLPAWLARQPRVEITRLAVTAGADARVRLALMKASWLYCVASCQRWIVIGARNDALIRGYRRLGFVDVFEADRRVPLAHAGDLPHRILAFDAANAECSWQASGHPLYDFMVHTVHPDLELFESLVSQPQETAHSTLDTAFDVALV
jgi:hypothetical protein